MKWQDISVDIKTLSPGGFLPPGGCLPMPRGYIHVQNREKYCIKSDVEEIFFELTTNDRSDKMCLLASKLRPQGVFSPCHGVYTCIKSWKKCIKSDFEEIFFKLVANDQNDKRFLLTSNRSQPRAFRRRSFAPISVFQGEVLVHIVDFPICSIHLNFSLSSK